MVGRFSSRALKPLALVSVLAALAVRADAEAAENWRETAAAACTTPTCLALGIGADTLQAVHSGEGASVEALANGLEYWLRSTGPLSVRLTAARYENGRLVRYGVSPRLDLVASDAGTALVGAADTIVRAFRGVTERALLVRGIVDGELGTAAIALDAFPNDLPPTFLIGQDGSLITSPAQLPLGEGLSGLVGAIVLVPADPGQRGESVARSFGLLVTLSRVPR